MAFASSNQKYVLGIDIGGTKIDAQLYPVIGGAIAQEPASVTHYDTQKGVEAHVVQIAKVIDDAANVADVTGGTLVGIGIGSPGRFDKDGAIKPGTNPNMGAGDDPINEFNGKNLKSLYSAELGSRNASLAEIPLFVGNDGNAMLAGMLEAIQKNRAGELADQNGNEVSAFSLRGKHVALLGLGTGVGHAITSVDGSGGFSFVTDGHASKLRVAVDDADWHMIEKAKANAGADAVVSFPDHTVRAEDLFRGPTVNAMAGVTDGRDIKPENPEHHEALKFAGKYMARTVQLIRSGKSQDVEPANGWTDDDKSQAAKTSVYLIGAGMGSSPLGAEIIRHAKAELGGDNADIRLVQVAGENQAARAAATMVPQSLLRGEQALSA